MSDLLDILAAYDQNREDLIALLYELDADHKNLVASMAVILNK